MVVKGHSHSVTGAAECDSEVNFSVLNGCCERVCYVRIVHAVGSVGTEVHHLITFAGEILHQPVLVLHACVVIAYTDFHE